MRMVEGRRRTVSHHDEMGEIKKGPWKEEEDEVLINHVKKYGARDWSSIRSKGLLKRTGKSCRLRWVNKLRPDLKSGVKFSAEEERTVIDLQAQFGNKWARIATYLDGRTDNDVKNFWSSRQKRLARILQTPPPSSSSSSTKSNNTIKLQIQTPAFLDTLSFEAPKLSSSTEEESGTKSYSCSSSHKDDSDTKKTVAVPELLYANIVNYEQSPLHLDYTPLENKPFAETEAQIAFPSIQTDFPLPLEGQDFMNINFLDVFGQTTGSSLDTAQFPLMPSLLGPERSCPMLPVKAECLDPVPPDSFIDDYPPMDMFDHIEPLPSPSEWS